MLRKMIGFERDNEGDWVVELGCAHRQHVRHKPPFHNHSWVISDEGRSSRLGQELNCPLCDRLEPPHGLEVYKRTPEFTTETIPQGLLRDHTLKSGVWGRIHVLEGQIEYTIPSLGGKMHQSLLQPGNVGIVAPEVPHHIAPIGPVRLFIEFLQRPPTAPSELLSKQ